MKLWPNVSGLSVAGIGFALPYLALLRDQTERCLALMPARQGVVNWPSRVLGLRADRADHACPCLISRSTRILLIHGLEEMSDDPEAMLEEAWRVCSRPAGG